MAVQLDSIGRAEAGVSAAVEDFSVKDLIAAKIRFLAPMIVIYLVGYVGVTVLAGFAKDLVAVKVVGSLNLGFVLIALNYVIAWVLALVYVRVANTVFDPMVKQAVAAGGPRP